MITLAIFGPNRAMLAEGHFVAHFDVAPLLIARATASKPSRSSAMNADDRFTTRIVEWHPAVVNELRRLRRTAGLLQKELAGLLRVPINTFRMWDSGLRSVPTDVLARVRHAIEQLDAIGRLPPEREREQTLGSIERRFESATENFLQPIPALMGKKVSDPSTPNEDAHADALLPLDVLARVIGVHSRTLQAAARDGRLPVLYDTRTTFRQLRARATIVDAWEFRRVSYRKPRHFPQRSAPFTLSDIPPDYDQRVRAMRKNLRISQAEYAALVGAAGKAVVYQWESRKRCPSRLFWSRIEALGDHPQLPQVTDAIRCGLTVTTPRQRGK